MDGRTCPGEQKCLNDTTNGEIGGVHGRANGRTLQNYCHDQPATKENGLKQGCPLYGTKPENVPSFLMGAIDAAEMLRRYKHRGTLPPISELTAWEYCCFDSAEEASDIVEAEHMKEIMKGSGGTNTVDKNTSMGLAGQEEEGGAFGNW